MSRKEAIEQKLSVLNPHFLEVIDESSKHLGHSGNPSGAGDTHFVVKIAAEKNQSFMVNYTPRFLICDSLKKFHRTVCEEFNA